MRSPARNIILGIGLSVCLGCIGALDSSAAEPAKSALSLAEAVEQKQFELAEDLLHDQAAVSVAQADGMMPLHWAVFHRQGDLVERLLRHGANPNAATRYGVVPLAIACQAGDARLVSALLNAGAEANVNLAGEVSLLMLASRTGDASCVQQLVHAGADINARDAKKQTPLMWAAAEGNVGVVKVLLDAGAEYERALTTGFTPFFFAVREGKREVVRLFLDRGVDVDGMMNPKNTGGRNARRGMTALHLAIENGHFELATDLLCAEADPNDQRCGFTPLHNLSWVRKPDRGDNIAGTPAPIGSGNMTSLELVTELVEAGAGVNATLKKGKAGRGRMNHKGATPFLFAARRNDLPLMKLLLSHGADPHIANADNCTALMVAAGIGTYAPGEEAGTEEEALACVEFLLTLGADVNHVDDNGETAMHGACYKSLPKMVALLAERGADVSVWNKKNKYGWTPTLIAEGHRPGNFKPAAATLHAVYQQLRANGIEPPAKTPPKHRLGYEQP
ncbi:MAG: ankyrin repeat domain-containing protein [Aureliella sp.]